MSLAQLKYSVEKDLSSHKFSIFINLKKHLFPSISDKLIAHQALKMVKQSRNYQILCILTYQQGEQNEKRDIYSKFDTVTEVQRFLIFKKKTYNFQIINLQFLAIFDKESYSLKDIINKVSQYNKNIFQLEPKVNRNFSHQTKNNQLKKPLQTKSKTNQSIKNNLLPTKSLNNTQQITKTQKALPRINQTKVANKTQVEASKKQSKKPKQPQYSDKNRKLQIQSSSQNQASQSQDIYDPKQTDLFVTTKNPKSENTEMELQNKGNYLQNQITTKQSTKMQIQTDQKDIKLQYTAIQQQNELDSDDRIFAQMNKKAAESKKTQMSKTQPVINKPSSTFKNSFQNPPSNKVASKQSTLFGFMKKK